VPGDEYREAISQAVNEYSGAISAVAAVVLVAACFLVLSLLQNIHTPEQSAAVTIPEVATPEKSPAAASPASAQADRSEIGTVGASTGLRIDLHPTGDCWVSATTDGKRVIYRTLQAGERQTVEGHNAVVLLLGDAERCSFSINGAPGRSLGRAGQPATVTLTRDNYASFVGQ